MLPKHLLFAFIVVALWGVNFVFIHLALLEIPPFLLCALRFFFSAIPLVFFLPRPRGPWRHLLGYGLATYAFQFSFLFTGMRLGMSPGLASLVMQMQTFFTVALAAWVLGERPTRWKLTGAVISFTGIVLVGFHSGEGTNLTGLILTLAASLSWASGNIFSKQADAPSPLALVAWGSLVATPVLILFSLAVDGPRLVFTALQNISWVAVLAIAYTVYLSTHVAYSLWGFLLNRYPTSAIAPFPLLVPVFGFLGSAVVLGESLPVWKMIASVLVMTGLAFSLSETRLKPRLARLLR